jgi:hypothetical protein
MKNEKHKNSQNGKQKYPKHLVKESKCKTN